MTATPAHRARLVAALHADLVGPDAGAWDAPEDLPIAPSRWYLTGFLACEVDREPQDPENEDGAGDDVDEGPALVAPESRGRNRKVYPASAGASFLLPPGDGGALDVDVRFATYRRVTIESGTGRRSAWRRSPHAVRVPVALDALGGGVALPGFPGLRLEACVARVAAPIADLPAGVRAVSLFLVNAQPKGPDGAQDEAWVFQVELAVAPPQGMAFLARPDARAAAGGDDDERVSDLRFRERRSYAVGHGVGVEESPGRVALAWLPRASVRRIVPAGVADVELGIDALAELAEGGDAARLRAALAPMVSHYRAWIAARGAEPLGALETPGRLRTREDLLHRAEIRGGPAGGGDRGDLLRRRGRPARVRVDEPGDGGGGAAAVAGSVHRGAQAAVAAVPARVCAAERRRACRRGAPAPAQEGAPSDASKISAGPSTAATTRESSPTTSPTT